MPADSRQAASAGYRPGGVSVRVLFVEPFYSGSHKVLLDGLALHSTHRIEPLTLPGERWRQRMRMGAQQLAAKFLQPRLNTGSSIDLVVAADMLDLPAFLALTRHVLASPRVLLYMHENQFTYPRVGGTKLNSWFGQINYLSALAADYVAFNSRFHRDDFLGALETLSRQPNNWLVPEAIGMIREKSFVLPLGLPLSDLDRFRRPASQGRLRILWNQRWEFDRAPDMFVRVITRLIRDGAEIEIAVAGDPGDNPHPALVGLPESLGDRLVHHGLATGGREYADLLWSSSIVASTTRHEFFGIGMVEALYCECIPVAPASFNYPSLVPADLHTPCLFTDEAGFEDRLRSFAAGPLPAPESLRRAAAQFDWSVMSRRWDEALEAVAAGRRPPLTEEE
ncbi:MAG: DUF3524 domain-containing protein [Dehalococcoidia bacterium]